MKAHIVALTSVTLLFASSVGACQDIAAARSQVSVKDLPPITVPAIKSPPLWLFTKGDKHLIVLGTQLPLPESGVVVTEPIKAYIMQSQAVLTGPGLKAGDSVGLLQGLTLAGSMRKAQRNDDDRMLSDVVPSNIYSRWVVLKSKYMGKDAGVEKLRPMYAAYELYAAALKQHQLTAVPKQLGSVIAKAADEAGMKRVDARYSLPVRNLRATVKAFNVPYADDVRCLEQTLEALEAYLEYSPAAADAWSVGDMERYRDVERQYVPIEACWAHLTNEAIGRSVGVAKPYDQVDLTWYHTITRSLASYDRVFTTLPARDLLNGTGLAGRLRADGFTVTELFAEH